MLSDIDTSSSEDESSEEEVQPVKNKKKNKDFTSLCFMADENDDLEPDSHEVQPFYDQLSVEVDRLTDMLVSQDRLIRTAARKVKEFKSKL